MNTYRIYHSFRTADNRLSWDEGLVIAPNVPQALHVWAQCRTPFVLQRLVDLHAAQLVSAIHAKWEPVPGPYSEFIQEWRPQ